MVPYDTPRHAAGTQELSVLPLFDDAGRLFCLIEYVREITDLNQEQRIVESLKRRIQFQDQTLQEQEVALEVLLRRSDKAARTLASGHRQQHPLSILPRDLPAEGEARRRRRRRGRTWTSWRTSWAGSPLRS